MIGITRDGSDIEVVVLGEFTLADFREFELTVAAAAGKQLNLLFDLREMAAFTVDMAWEEIRFSHSHGADFGRIAVLTDSQWVIWSAWLNQAFVPADIRVFADPGEARQWLAEDS